MKKLLALLLVVLILSMIPCFAYAEGDKQDVVPVEAPVEEEEDKIPEYNWGDIVPYVEALGLEGKFYSLTYFGLDFWVPNELEFQALSDEELENGLVAYATDADENWKFAVAHRVYDQQIESLYAWQEILKEQAGVEGSVLCYVNDLFVLEYMLPEKDSFVCDLRVNDGSILEFMWAPFSDSTYAMDIGFMSNSLMVPAE